MFLDQIKLNSLPVSSRHPESFSSRMRTCGVACHSPLTRWRLWRRSLRAVVTTWKQNSVRPEMTWTRWGTSSAGEEWVHQGVFSLQSAHYRKFMLIFWLKMRVNKVLLGLLHGPTVARLRPQENCLCAFKFDPTPLCPKCKYVNICLKYI